VIAPDGPIRKANATLAQWIGTPAAALAGRPLRELLTAPAAALYETRFAPLLRRKGGFEEAGLDLVTAGGERLPVLVSASERRDAAGAPTAIRMVAVRAAERRGYERDLQMREATAVRRLEDEQEVSSLREQFIAVLGHDLRNPLAAVSSGVRLLQRDPSREKAERIAGMMHASVLRMSARRLRRRAALADGLQPGGQRDYPRRSGNLYPRRGLCQRGGAPDRRRERRRADPRRADEDPVRAVLARRRREAPEGARPGPVHRLADRQVPWRRIDGEFICV
jgi:hypothetical protein